MSPGPALQGAAYSQPQMCNVWLMPMCFGASMAQHGGDQQWDRQQHSYGGVAPAPAYGGSAPGPVVMLPSGGCQGPIQFPAQLPRLVPAAAAPMVAPMTMAMTEVA